MHYSVIKNLVRILANYAAANLADNSKARQPYWQASPKLFWPVLW
jgi:hypothetical protein